MAKCIRQAPRQTVCHLYSDRHLPRGTHRSRAVSPAPQGKRGQPSLGSQHARPGMATLTGREGSRQAARPSAFRACKAMCSQPDWPHPEATSAGQVASHRRPVVSPRNESTVDVCRLRFNSCQTVLRLNAACWRKIRSYSSQPGPLCLCASLITSLPYVSRLRVAWSVVLTAAYALEAHVSGECISLSRGFVAPTNKC